MVRPSCVVLPLVWIEKLVIASDANNQCLPTANSYTDPDHPYDKIGRRYSFWMVLWVSFCLSGLIMAVFVTTHTVGYGSMCSNFDDQVSVLLGPNSPPSTSSTSSVFKVVSGDCIVDGSMFYTMNFPEL